MRISDWSSDVCSSDLSDETFRRDIFSARLATSRARDRYSATASYEVRESGDDDESEKIKSLGVTWSHDLTRSMSLNTSVSYDNIDFSGLDKGRADTMSSFQPSLPAPITSDVAATATRSDAHTADHQSQM